MSRLDPVGIEPSSTDGDILTTVGGVTAWAADSGGSGVGFTTTPEEHGAAGDGTTDDTTAIIAAIDACDTAGGGDVLFDAKTYLCDGTLRTDRNGNAVIPLPVGTRSPIRLIGVTPANNCSPAVDTGYTVLKTTKTGLTYSATDGTPSLIGGPTDGTWVETMVTVANICFWLPANPTLAGVDLRYIRRIEWDGASVQAINSGDSDYTQPTSVYAFALRTPDSQNYHTVLIKSGQAHGTYVGLAGSVESLTLTYWASKWCWIGWAPMTGGHGGMASKIGLEWCPYAISGWSETAGVTDLQTSHTGDTEAQLSVSHLALEDASSGWYSTVEHVHDPTNQLYGVVFFEHYSPTTTGPVSTITTSGGTNVDFIPLLAPSFGSALAVEDDGTQIDAAVTSIDFTGDGVEATTDGSGAVTVTITQPETSSGEVLMTDGTTSPPEPVWTEDGSDWLYEG